MSDSHHRLAAFVALTAGIAVVALRMASNSNICNPALGWCLAPESRGAEKTEPLPVPAPEASFHPEAVQLTFNPEGEPSWILPESSDGLYVEQERERGLTWVEFGLLSGLIMERDSIDFAALHEFKNQDFIAVRIQPESFTGDLAGRFFMQTEPLLGIVYGPGLGAATNQVESLRAAYAGRVILLDSRASVFLDPERGVQVVKE